MTHFSNSQLNAFLQGKLSPDQVLAADDHLASYPDCRADLERAADVEVSAGRLQEVFAPAQTHLNYEQLQQLAEDQSVDAEAAAHASSCASCADEIRQLRAFITEVSALPRSADPENERQTGTSLFRLRLIWYALAAGILLAAVTGQYWRHSRLTPAGSDVLAVLHDGNSQLTIDKAGQLQGAQNIDSANREAMRAALTTGKLPGAPDAGFSSRKQQTMLGATGQAASFKVLSPVGCILLAEHPSFQWEALSGASGYRVTIYGPGYQRIAQSPELHQTEWQSSVPLERGVMYTWTVTAEGPKGAVKEPAPPQPEAEFKIMSAKPAADLEHALQNNADDHLLLAVLYARAGAVDEALAQLDLLAEENPNSRLIGELRNSIAKSDANQSPSPISTNAAQ